MIHIVGKGTIERRKIYGINMKPSVVEKIDHIANKTSDASRSSIINEVMEKWVVSNADA